MTCFKCGHIKQLHYVASSIRKRHQANYAACVGCYRIDKNEVTVWRHRFEDNLMYLERRSMEKTR
jgi:hypothetical protein